MAARMSVENLQDEVSCSICLELFQDPVSIHCGHSFCRACITQNWKGLTTNFSCPRCRETVPQESLRPNWELANIIEIAKNLNLQSVREVERGENLCKEHQEALKLFCEDEERLICMVCDRSKVHRNHSVVPVDEAAQEYKERIQTQLQFLKLEQKALQSSMGYREDSVQDYTVAEKQKIVTEYKQLHKLLEEQESFLLAELEQLDAEIMKAHEEILNRLLEETTSLGMLIGEMERICQQPDYELLKDIKTTLSRCEREMFSQPLDISPELEKKFCDFTEKTAVVKEAMEKFQGILEFKLPLRTQMTLDLKTANAELYLVEDCRVMWWGSYEQVLPSSPERFKAHPCVLGSRGFTSGWHCWEVEIYGEGMWAIGVAKESVPRESWFPLKPEAGIWALCHSRDGYQALTSPDVTPLALHNVPQRIRICLNCQEGRVVFFDAAG
ncbi:PREDICTED: E3 ubiquitin-protein ligase TRIM39-like [Fulmarus glacialis]|uniref:E3 ubiquitin-protein ligase TRIM39-like n=1 Tax=Fulmarus glacialis TaxID=30455 RepID=UPI00051C543E|nr:PREDICTED: E3 ubiquitin-protein ligase TRIM39-like [Fulmarus glacialis]